MANYHFTGAGGVRAGRMGKGPAGRRSVWAAVAATALLTTACGSDGIAGHQRPGGQHGGGGGHAAGGELVLGNVGTISGPLGERYGIMQKAVQAWADTVNENGGVGGHRIRLEVADDANDPDKHLSIVRDMVENKHVVAFIGPPAPNTQEAAVEYLEEKGIPVIGGVVGEHPWGESPILFPHAVAAHNKSRVLLYTAAATGKTKYAFIGINTHGQGHPGQPSIEEFTEGFKSGVGEEMGVELTFEAEIEPNAPDSEYTKVCRDAKAAGTEMMTIVTDFNIQKKVIDACVAQQFTPIYVTTGTTTDQKLVDLAGAKVEGAVGLSRTAPWMADQPADLGVWRTAMASHNVEANGTSLQGWVSGRIFEVAMMMGVQGEVTSDKITKSLRGISGADLRGMAAPLEFGKSPSEPNPGSKCFWLLAVKNGKWTPSEKGRVCLA